MMTLDPFLTNIPIPPAALIAWRTISSGSVPCTTTRYGKRAAVGDSVGGDEGSGEEEENGVWVEDRGSGEEVDWVGLMPQAERNC